MLRLMGLFFGLAGFGILCGAIWAYSKQRVTLENRVVAAGTVVELVNPAATGNRASILCPVVEFTALSGHTIRFTSKFGAMPAKYRVGQSVKVRYDAADPRKAEIESALTLWLAPLILALMGLVACCLGVAFLAIFGMFPSMFAS